MLEIDLDKIKSEPLEIKFGIVDINDIDKLIIDILQKYEEFFLRIQLYEKSIYIYSMYLIINACAL